MSRAELVCLAVALVAGVIAFGRAHGPVSLDVAPEPKPAPIADADVVSPSRGGVGANATVATGVLLYSTGASSTLSGSCGATFPAATDGLWRAACVVAPPEAPVAR